MQRSCWSLFDENRQIKTKSRTPFCVQSISPAHFFSSLTLIDRRLIKAYVVAHTTDSNWIFLLLNCFFFFSHNTNSFENYFISSFFISTGIGTRIARTLIYIIKKHIYFIITSSSSLLVASFFCVSLHSFGKFFVFSMVRAISGIAHETRFTKWWHKYM